MYKSPIQLVTDDINYAMRAKIDDTIFQAVLRCGVDVNKDELIKALTYDREQYDKGYSDGYTKGKADALVELKRELMKMLDRDLMYGGKDDA